MRNGEIKDCVRQLLARGVHEKPPPGKWHRSEQKKAAYLILLELQRIDVDRDEPRQMIVDWNEDRNDPPMPMSQARHHIVDLVDWVYDRAEKSDRRFELGCTGLLRDGGLAMRGVHFDPICLGPENCDYHQSRIGRSLDSFDEDAFYDNGWYTYLLNNFVNGMYAYKLYLELRYIAMEKGLSQRDPIYVGFRALAKRLSKKIKDDPSPMGVVRAMRVLEQVGLVKTVEKGRPGPHGKRANGYMRILPIPGVPDKDEDGQ